ncbi:MAG: radical SAM protein [Thermodesulfobacteriota bacterium]|nr:radical SAM protein [Thermodesulfobacteriota bacterium]
MKACVQPVGLAYMAAVLREKNYEVRILDSVAEGYDEPEVEVEPEIFRYGMSNENIVKRIEDFGPDLVCIGCPQLVRLPEALKVVSLSKGVSPKVPVVMGGGSVSALGADLFKLTEEVDFVVCGEGEERLCDLIKALQSPAPNLSAVDGLIYRKDKAIVVNPAVKVVRNLDALPLPAYDLLPMEIYFEKNHNPSVHSSAQKTCTIITSRGCPHTCYYCPVHRVFGPGGPRFRMRSIESILTELDFLVSRYAIQEVQFEDANFNASIPRTITLSRAIGERFPNLRWTTPHGNQISTLTPEVLRAMAEGGCYSLHLAIESGNQGFLEQRKNSIQLSDVETLLKRVREMGFLLSTFFMIGFPEETREDIATTVNYAESLDLDDVHFFIAVPFQGTEMYDICRDNGWLVPNPSWRHFRYSVGVIETDEFDPSYLQRVRREAWLRIQGQIGIRKPHLDLSQREEVIYG